MLNTYPNFKALAEFVRRHFFPRWDRKGRWKVVQANDLDGAQGRCDNESKTVKIRRGISGDDVTAILIHEICHAVGELGHGKRWRRRMEQAARTADALAMAAVAERLREEIKGYEEGLFMSASDIYREISDAIWQYPKVTFVQVLDFVRRDYGLSRAQFMKRFRRSKRVFTEAKREAEETAAIKAKVFGATKDG